MWGRMVAVLMVLMGLSACGGTDAGETPAASSSAAASGTPSASTATTPTAAPTPTKPPPVATRLGLKPGWGPGWKHLNRATRIVQRMSLPELAGQVIVARYTGTAAPVELVNSLHLGGVIAFSDNVPNAATVAEANRELQARAGRGWPLWISVDQEGGIVTRIHDGVTDFPNASVLGATRDPALTRRVGAVMGHELAQLGFTVDFAPVADVTIGAADPTIGPRSYGTDPRQVARHAAAFTAGLESTGVVPVPKHFPGHGSATTDSHAGLPTIPASRAQLRARDLVPFRALIAEGAPAIMVGHLRVPAYDAERPASLSRPIITGLLRRQLGFNGLVTTDALNMGAISGGTYRRDPSVLSIAAGTDVVLMPPDPAATRAAIIAAVRDGFLKRSRLEQAAARQIALLLSEERTRARTLQRDLDGVGVARDLAQACGCGW